MTAIQVPGTSHQRRFRLRRRELSEMERESRTLLGGKPVRFRTEQMLVWSVVVGLLAASFIAGLYFGVLEVNWHVFWLKPGWDKDAWGLVHSGNWALYRHAAFRDQAEPAIATMVVMSFLARSKWWGVRVRPVRLVTAPVVLLAMVFGLGIFGVWAIDFGLPNAWHHIFGALGHPGYRIRLSFLGKLSVETLVYGYVMGRVLHRYWAPVGATIQGYQIDRAVDRAKSRGKDGIVPLWVRLPLSPPVIRERFGYIWRHDASIDLGGNVHKVLLALLGIVIVLVTLLGVLGHYYVGVLGHSVPFLAP